jgi:predicted phage terminase large subunit-like protein
MVSRKPTKTDYRTVALTEAVRRELHRRQQQARPSLSLADWLQQASPNETWDWPHVQHVIAHLERVTTGETRRLMLFMPPRHGKSHLTTIRYPVYRLEHAPGFRVILGCYSRELADLFSRQARTLARERGLVGRGIDKAAEWDTVNGGTFFAAGVGRSVTGRGGNLIIIDDPIAGREAANSQRYRDKVWDWFTNDVATRAEPGASIILIQTRWHQDDLAGRILASADAPNWTVISLPAEAEENDPLGREVGEALCPERYSRADLETIKERLGLDYYALYQQRPVARDGAIYRQEWLVYAAAPPTFERVIQAWDTASSRQGDWSACLTVGVAQGTAYVLDIFRARVEGPDLLTAVRAQATKHTPQVILIEDASSGIVIAQMLKRETMLPIIAVKPFREGKISHAQANTPYLESGRVVFCPERIGQTALSSFEEELLSFPSGTHDDQVDAFNIALTRIFGMGTQKARTYDSRNRWWET